MERWVGRVALVTGASVGIGAATAMTLARHGMKVIGCGRDLEALQKVAESVSASNYKGTLNVMRCDVSQEEEIRAMFQVIKEEHGGVDVCINNAGLSHQAPLVTGSTDRWREMLNVNVLGLTIVMQAAVKSMLENGVTDGQIINLCSMSGHRVPTLKNSHFYSATKAAVKALTEGMRQEMREMKKDIRVAQLCPGIVETEFFRKMNGPEAANKMYKKMRCLQPSDVADSIVYILSAPQHMEVNDILMRSTDQMV